MGMSQVSLGLVEARDFFDNTSDAGFDIGMPKIMVSTVASGNTPYVDCSDITMMHSVVDVAGLNVVSRKILGERAHAMAGMVRTRSKHSRTRAPWV